MFKWYNELTKNKAIFVKKLGKFFVIIGSKYVSVKTDSIKYKKSKKDFSLKTSDLLNKYGKRVYFVDYDEGTNLSFTEVEKNLLSPDEMDAFVNQRFMTFIVRSLKGAMYDYTSIIIGACIGVPLGWIISTLIGG